MSITYLQDYIAEQPNESLSPITLGANGSMGSTATEWPPVDLIHANELCARFPHKRSPIVDGLLRQGETMNVIAPPKIGKTWLVHGMVNAVALGEPWLGFDTARCKVLICDAELHKEDSSERLNLVCSATALDEIDTWPLRGCNVDINELCKRLRGCPTGTYGMIVIDALYRFLPVGTSENDNGAMMLIYNQLDSVAKSTGAAIVIVHHSSKGDQSDKSVTDVGAGAGSIARATDTHVVIRKHEAENAAVLESVCRSFRSPEPRTIAWESPSWSSSSLAPKVAQSNDRGQASRDKESKEKLLSILSLDKTTSISKCRKATGYGDSRIRRAMNLLGDKVVLRKVKSRNTTSKRPTDGWRLASDCSSQVSESNVCESV